MRYVFKYKKRFLCGIVVVIILFILLHPRNYAGKYHDYIDKKKIWDNLYLKTSKNLSILRNIDCEYVDILSDDTTLAITPEDGDLVEGHHIREGGEYVPIECKPKFSTAIIVPYR